MKHQVISPVIDVRGAPDTYAPRGKFETQLVRGEIFIVEEEKDGWCKGTCAHDGYPGYIQSKHLSKSSVTPTHVVTEVRCHSYRDATLKSQALETLSFGSLVAVTQVDQNWAEINGGGWIYRKALTPVDIFDKDPIAIARKFLETPYYWGGRSGFGLDCSGLIQVVLARAGISIKRDTEDQETSIGINADTARKGDIVFFPGHVGMMVDDENIIHANAFHMKVTIEPLTVVTERSRKITAIKRGLRFVQDKKAGPADKFITDLAVDRV